MVGAEAVAWPAHATPPEPPSVQRLQQQQPPPTTADGPAAASEGGPEDACPATGTYSPKPSICNAASVCACCVAR